jgi:hypothetical protein
MRLSFRNSERYFRTPAVEGLSGVPTLKINIAVLDSTLSAINKIKGHRHYGDKGGDPIIKGGVSEAGFVNCGLSDKHTAYL